MNKTFIVLGCFIIVVAIVCIALHFAGVPVALTTTIATGIFGLFPTISQTVKERDIKPKERIENLVNGNYFIHPLLGVLYFICYMYLIEFIVGAVFGLASSLTYGSIFEESIANTPINSGTGLLTFLVGIFAVFPISKYIANHIKRFPFLWILCALILTRIIDILIIRLLINENIELTQQLIAQSVYILLSLPGIILGFLRARKTKLNFVMNHLFRQLSPSNKQILIDLVLTLPDDPDKQANLSGIGNQG